MRRTIGVVVAASLLTGTFALSADANHIDRRGRTPPPVVTPPPPPTFTPPPTATPTPPPYPPDPGADCAVTGIATGPWRIGRYNAVEVFAENHGSEQARCSVTLQNSADIRPGSYQIVLQPGQTVRVLFFARPVSPGTFQLTACATAVAPVEAHPADDCATTTVTAA